MVLGRAILSTRPLLDPGVLQVLVEKLKAVEPKYFTHLTYKIQHPGFQLPRIDGDPLDTVLAALFDLIRNG